MSKTFILSLIASLALIGGARAAEAPDGVKQTTVYHADLNLAQAKDARVLLQRIGFAARSVCGPAPTLTALDQMAEFNRCRTQATSQAVRAVASPMLTATYENRELPRQLASVDRH